MYILLSYIIIMAMNIQEAAEIINNALDTQEFGPEREEAMEVIKQHTARDLTDALTAELAA